MRSNDDLEVELARLSEEKDRLKKDRDSYWNELKELRIRGDATISAQLRVESVTLAKNVREEVMGHFITLGKIVGLGVAVGTLGGVLSFKEILTNEINKAVNYRAEDIAKLRADSIQASIESQRKAKEALQMALGDIEAAKRNVAESSRIASDEIDRTRIRFASSSAATSELSNKTGDTVTIPVVVHVVYKVDGENISNAQIRSQIAVLNKDYRAKNEDIEKVPAPFKPFIGDVGIEFVLATVDPRGNKADGITRTKTQKSSFSADDSIKFTAKGGEDAWPTDRFLNIWVCSLAGGILGYAQFPGGPQKTDGVVISNSNFGTTGTVGAPYNLGRTATSEIAHYLNVRNVWGDTADCSGSDFVVDTPNQQHQHFGKPKFPHISCNNGPNGDMFMNFADSVDDDSMYMFSKGQAMRMQETLRTTRSRLGRQ